MNPLLKKRSQPIPPQHSLKNCRVLVGIQVALEKIRKKNREDFLNGTKEEDFHFFFAKSISLAKGKPKISHRTLRSPTYLDPGEFEDKMPYELPSEWVNAWVNSSETIPSFRLFVGSSSGWQHTEAPNPWASASLFGTLLGDFHFGIFPLLSYIIYIWFLGQPRLSLHAFFFLLCRWKAVFGDGFGEG